LFPGLLRITEGARGIGRGIRGRDEVSRSARIGPDQLKCLGPILGLQCQFGPLLPEPNSAWMGGLGLVGNNQRLWPVATIDSLT
jgi:hypothetical protein